MKRSTLMSTALASAIALCLLASPAKADLPGRWRVRGILRQRCTTTAHTLWYNGDADGGNAQVNQYNNDFTCNQVVYNDFNVTGPGWTIQSVWSNDIFLNGPPDSTNADWEIRSNMPTGTLVASGDARRPLLPQRSPCSVLRNTWCKSRD